MTYKVLYRQWRPQDFKSLVGQEHISTTLQNAIKTGRIAHAYLFCGPRGTGKTSTAKILAKAVNCESLQDGEPCNVCPNCENITGGRSLDVLEMDAASNRGIDEIRDIRERVGYVPGQGKYKVYIIDEVHMLTTEAFNALLKTLEEPPAHVIFILATTEAHKIPATILSRCQRFDFRRISPLLMEERLAEILAASQITAEEGVLDLIVRKAEGGLRDAISILDQCLSFSQEQLSLQTAYDVLGVVKSDALLALTDALMAKDAAQVLTMLNTMMREGIEPNQVIKDLLEHLRNIVLLLVCGENSPLAPVSDKERTLYYEQGRQLGHTWLGETIAVLARIDSESRWRQNTRIILETTLLGLMLPGSDAIEAKSKAAPGKSGVRKADAKGTDSGKEDSVKIDAGKTDALKTNLKKTGSGRADSGKPVSEQPAQPGKVREQEASAIITTQPEKTLQDKNVKRIPANPAALLLKVQDKWPQVMALVKEQKKAVHAFLTECEPSEIRDKKLVLLFKKNYTFHKEKIEAPENRKLIEGILERLCDEKIQYICLFEEENSSDTPEDPVQKALDIFGPDLVTIKD